MIAACVERLAGDECDGCERRDACASLFNFFRSRGSWSDKPAPDMRFSAFLRGIANVMDGLSAPKQAQFRQRAEQQLEQLLASGPVRIQALAAALGLSRQTLYRRLKAEGVTFEDLRDSVRRRMALRLLREEGLSVKETAWRLGFSDPAAFSRAFKRWTGSSPSELRAQAR